MKVAGRQSSNFRSSLKMSCIERPTLQVSSEGHLLHEGAFLGATAVPLGESSVSWQNAYRGMEASEIRGLYSLVKLFPLL